MSDNTEKLLGFTPYPDDTIGVSREIDPVGWEKAQRTLKDYAEQKKQEQSEFADFLEKFDKGIEEAEKRIDRVLARLNVE